MKSSVGALVAVLALSTGALSAQAEDGAMAGHVASFIPMTAAPGQTQTVADYLAGAAQIVRETEPGTVYWFGLQAPGDQLANFDVFVDEAARRAHFAGRVARDINENADSWIVGGWEAGVLANVTNATILSARRPVDLARATTATHIALRARPGQGDALAELLTAGGPIVEQTEPGTLFWVALRIDEDDFAIFDVFADEEGRTAHFAGQVAALLKQQAADLVEGGWKDGVVANVSNFDIIAMR